MAAEATLQAQTLVDEAAAAEQLVDEKESAQEEA